MLEGGCDQVGSRVQAGPVVPCGEEPTLEKEKSLSNPYTREEGDRREEKKCDELNHIPHSPALLCHWQGEHRENWE